MLKDQCISITDLRKNASKYIKDLKNKPKYIFVNNKPIAVLVDVDDFNFEISENSSFHFDPPLDPKQFLDEYYETYGKEAS